jgi:hypothetical protein
MLLDTDTARSSFAKLTSMSPRRGAEGRPVRRRRAIAGVDRPWSRWRAGRRRLTLARCSAETTTLSDDVRLAVRFARATAHDPAAATMRDGSWRRGRWVLRLAVASASTRP